MYFFVVKYKVQIITGLRAMFESGYFSSVQSTTEQKRKNTRRKKARQGEQRRQEGRRQDRDNKEDRKEEQKTEQRRQKGRRQDRKNISKTMERVEALHAYFCLLLACGVLSLTVSASVHPGAREDVMGQYRLTNRQQCHRLCWYRALCGSYSYHTESSAPLMDVSTPSPNCVLHAENDSENCLCSVCLCSAHTT